MAKELDKQELVRLAWTTELRRQGHRQCVVDLSKDGRVCALGLLCEVAGLPCSINYVQIGNAAGLSIAQVSAVWKMNDGDDPFFGPPIRKHTFAEIADVVEGWFQ